MQSLKIMGSFKATMAAVASLEQGKEINTSADAMFLDNDKLKEKIRSQLNKVELTASSYDTAWVAMAPSTIAPQSPCFPECLQWIVENQHPGGSWGPLRSSLIKDSLSSTLSCVLALQKWRVGHEHVKRGVKFIKDNFSCAIDERLHSPIGFYIIFPGMLQVAIDMGIELLVDQSEINALFSKKNAEFLCCEEKKAFLAYIAEGLGKSQDWREIMKYQRKNGSLFNSPSATAAAMIHLRDDNALEYLSLLLKNFGSSVPTVYPLNVYTHLCTIDAIERLGVARHFQHEIRSILDGIYRGWLQNDDEIYLDATTLAMAFRILRMNGYNVSSDALSQLVEVDHLHNSVQGHLKDVNLVFELYKASLVKISSNEVVLDALHSWSRIYLQGELVSECKHGALVSREVVDYALNFPFYANLDRLEHKRYIELFDLERIHMRKTSFKSCGISENDLLQFAMEDFRICQSMHQKELQLLEEWVKENNFDQLEFARQKQTFCYFSTAATLFSIEYSDARMSWAKNSILTTLVDDFFDVGGSRKEIENLITLVEKWDGNHKKECCSKQVEIIFSALYSTLNELSSKAYALQNCSSLNHLIDIWLNLMKSMKKETEWLWNKEVPTVEEYMTNGYVSFALGPIIFPTLYFVCPGLSEVVIRSSECQKLFKLVSTCGRLLNDVQGFEQEGREGKLNSLSLRIHHNGNSTTEEEKIEIQNLVESSRTELLHMVLQEDGSVVPRPCKEVFWKMCKVLHLFYRKNDGFSSPKELAGAVSAVIHEPLK